MSRTIIKLIDPKDQKAYYLEWSSVVDAPVTYGMPLEEFREYYREEYGRRGMDDLDDRMVRVETCGTSSRRHESPEDAMSFNRAGPKETRLSVEEILEKYCRNRPNEEAEPCATTEAES